jgi:hypothetical protein
VQFALGRAGCDFTAAESSLSFFPTVFEAKSVRFHQGREAATAIQAEIELIEAPISLMPLLVGKIRLGEVVLHRPRVEVIEGDEESPDEDGSGPPDLRVAGARIHEGEFRYIRVYPGKKAVIRVGEINGMVGELNAASDTPTPGRVSAVLEKSGAVELHVEAAYFADSPKVSVDLRIRGQALPRLNSYFVPADGVELFGTLTDGRGRVSLLGDRVEARVEAKYTDFDVMLRATRQRSKGEAFLGNLFRSLKLDGDNLDEPSRDQSHGVRLTRGKESVISALLRGLKAALLHIATT